MNEQQEPSPPTLGYATPPPPKSVHGQVFTGMLIAMGLLCLLVIGQFIAMLQNPSLPAESRWVYYYVISIQGVVLFSILLAIVVRAMAPTMRRVITIGVSVFLLIYFPFGTAIGIYGLWKVDRVRHPN